MKNLFLIKISIIMIFFLGSCSESRLLYKEAKKANENGNFERAVDYAFSSLDKKSDFKKSREILPLVAKKYINELIQDIETNKRMADKFYFKTTEDNAVLNYNHIKKQYNKISYIQKKITSYSINFEIVNYSQEIEQTELILKEYNNLAAIYCYDQGLKLEKSAKNKDDFKKSSKWFKNTNLYATDFKDANERTEQNRKAGIKRISILPFQNKSGKEEFNSATELITDNVIDAIQNDKESQDFLELYNRERLNAVITEQKNQLSANFDEKTAVEAGKLASIEEILFGKISKISYNIGEDRKSKYTIESRIKTGYVKKLNDKGQTVDDYSKPIYKYFSAEIIKFTRSYSSSINVSYNFVDVKTSKQKDGGIIEGSYKKDEEWGSYNGASEIFSDYAEWKINGSYSTENTDNSSEVLKLLTNITKPRNTQKDYYKNLTTVTEPQKLSDEELVQKAIDDLKLKLIKKIFNYTR